MHYLFEEYALDTDRRELWRGTDAVPVEPQVFDLLVYLIRNRDRVVSKDDMLASVWHGRHVSESTLNTRISAARFAVCDSGEEQRLIKTLPRKGVRFIGNVREEPKPATPVHRQPVAAGEGPVAGLQPIAAPPIDRHRVLPALRAGGLAAWRAPAAVLVCVGLGAAYMIEPSRTPDTKMAHVGPMAEAPVAPKPRPAFKDCDVCPEMVALPAGEFMMGSPEDDDLRLHVEGPPRRVSITKRFAIGRFEITVDQFAAFVTQTGTVVSKSYNACRVVIGFELEPPAFTGSPNASFRQLGFDVSGTHPAGCISWYDAQAYVAWLRRKTGKQYRLPTEVEWEYAARAGTSTRYSFGDDERQLCSYARFADLSSRYAWRDGCRSDIATEGPIEVGRLKLNAWGLFDMHGNVSEWVEDCWTPVWSEIPTNGSAYARPSNCEMGVTRGGSWLAGAHRARAAVRFSRHTPVQYQFVGFRVALTLDAP